MSLFNIQIHTKYMQVSKLGSVCLEESVLRSILINAFKENVVEFHDNV